MIKAVIMDEAAMRRAITRISFEIVEKNKGIEALCIAGIRTRGVSLAQEIAKKIAEIEGKEISVGTIDISGFRDDGRHCEDRGNQTELPFSVVDQKIILVDDVLYTGRTARAAMDAVMSVGRPLGIQLAVLVDRGHRELPIRPDYVGKNVPTSREEKVVVHVAGHDGENKVYIEQRA